ncbi:alpha/beta fold hydrolase [Pigmentiphaga humi]|nr:alpha/beta hydrolase [Pigmentiphaga humi]
MADITRHLIDTRFGQVHCRTMGRSDAPALAIAHINQQSSALQIELMQALGAGVRSVAIDYPSHGMSDPIDFQPGIQDYADCVQDVMNGLGIARYSTLGEATGAAVALETGIRHTAHVERVVLLNCPIYRDRKQAHDVHAPLKSGLRPADASGFPVTRTLEFMLEHDPSHSPFAPTQSWMDRVNRAQIEVGRNRWQALDALNAYDVGSGLERLDKDTLLLMGEHFHYTSRLEEYRARLRRLESARIIAGARFGMAWEKADEVADAVRAFLRA